MRDTVAAHLASCRELATYCTRNGWIDNDSIEFEFVQDAPDSLLVAVKFTEVTMKGAGCEARRLPCFARLRLTLGADGAIVATDPAER